MSRSNSTLTLDRLLQLPHWEVVVVGVRNSRRVLGIVADQLSDRTVFEQSLSLAEEVVRGHCSAISLDPHSHEVYRAAARVAARHRTAAEGATPELVAAAQSIHLIIDAIADFDYDSYDSVCATYLSIKAASRLHRQEISVQLGLDLGQVSAICERLLPTGEILDAFGPLWSQPG